MFRVEGISHKRRMAIVVAVAVVVFLSWSGLIDSLSKEYVDGSIFQALAAFATARTINALVSLASSVTIEGSAGVGIVGSFGIQPFQILDPINDLIEQYSTAMKFSVASLVVQKILIEMVSTWIFKFLLTFLGIAFIVSMYIKEGAYSFTMLRLFSLLALVRFLFVLVVAMNGIVDKAFIDKNVSPRLQEVSTTANQLEGQLSEEEGGLSEDERQGLISMKEELEESKLRLEVSAEMVEEEVGTISSDVEEARAVLADLESGMGTIERYNVFSREEAHDRALEDLAQKESYLSEKQKELADLRARMTEIDEDTENTIDILEGRVVDEGWLTGIKQQLAGFRDMAMWERIKESVGSIVPSILNLMAAFVLKTLIMPIIFLALFLKGFKYIWGMDPRKWAKDEYQKIKKEE